MFGSTAALSIALTIARRASRTMLCSAAVSSRRLPSPWRWSSLVAHRALRAKSGDHSTETLLPISPSAPLVRFQEENL
jgi:hypothetical protein